MVVRVELQFRFQMVFPFAMRRLMDVASGGGFFLDPDGAVPLGRQRDHALGFKVFRFSHEKLRNQ